MRSRNLGNVNNYTTTFMAIYCAVKIVYAVAVMLCRNTTPVTFLVKSQYSIASPRQFRWGSLIGRVVAIISAGRSRTARIKILLLQQPPAIWPCWAYCYCSALFHPAAGQPRQTSGWAKTHAPGSTVYTDRCHETPHRPHKPKIGRYRSIRELANTSLRPYVRPSCKMPQGTASVRHNSRPPPTPYHGLIASNYPASSDTALTA